MCLCVTGLPLDEMLLEMKVKESEMLIAGMLPIVCVCVFTFPHHSLIFAVRGIALIHVSSAVLISGIVQISCLKGCCTQVKGGRGKR